MTIRNNGISVRVGVILPPIGAGARTSRTTVPVSMAKQNWLFRHFGDHVGLNVWLVPKSNTLLHHDEYLNHTLTRSKLGCLDKHCH